MTIKADSVAVRSLALLLVAQLFSYWAPDWFTSADAGEGLTRLIARAFAAVLHRNTLLEACLKLNMGRLTVDKQMFGADTSNQVPCRLSMGKVRL